MAFLDFGVISEPTLAHLVNVPFIVTSLLTFPSGKLGDKLGLVADCLRLVDFVLEHDDVREPDLLYGNGEF